MCDVPLDLLHFIYQFYFHIYVEIGLFDVVVSLDVYRIEQMIIFVFLKFLNNS
jgi:hypothetical protein